MWYAVKSLIVHEKLKKKHDYTYEEQVALVMAPNADYARLVVQKDIIEYYEGLDSSYPLSILNVYPINLKRCQFSPKNNSAEVFYTMKSSNLSPASYFKKNYWKGKKFGHNQSFRTNPFSFAKVNEKSSNYKWHNLETLLKHAGLSHEYKYVYEKRINLIYAQSFEHALDVCDKAIDIYQKRNKNSAAVGLNTVDEITSTKFSPHCHGCQIYAEFVECDVAEEIYEKRYFLTDKDRLREA